MKISLFIIFLGLCTVAPAIYFGVTLFDGKVTDKPYETGLEYDRINKVIKNYSLAINDVKTEKKDGNVVMTFLLNHKAGLNLKNISFFVSRPATDNGRIALAASRQPDGSYAGEFKQNGYGNFILEAQTRVANEDISLEKNFYINK